MKIRTLISKYTHIIGNIVGSGFGSGLSPIAPGTAGTIVAAVIYYLLPISSISVWFILIIISTIIGIWACGSLVTESDPDPGTAVWDEFVGMWVTCLYLPKEIIWLTSAFLIFRLLDIVKPFPARKLEELPAGLGIMADDILVGIYGAIILNAIHIIIQAQTRTI